MTRQRSFVPKQSDQLAKEDRRQFDKQTPQNQSEERQNQRSIPLGATSCDVFFGAMVSGGLVGVAWLLLGMMFRWGVL